MNEEILFTVMKKDVEARTEIRLMPAKLKRFKRTQVINVRYPAATETGISSDLIEGVLITNLSTKDFKFLDWFEGDEYSRVTQTVEVVVKEKIVAVEAHVYKWVDSKDKLIYKDWDDSWLKDNEKVRHWLKNEIEDLQNCPTFE